MFDENKRNLQYFESSSMKGLFDLMDMWQVENKKRLLSVSIEKDGDKFCCISLTNPTEVIIMDGRSSGGAEVTNARLKVLQR
jgi:hypothetical protein